MVRPRILIPTFGGSNPSSPAKYASITQLVEYRLDKAEVPGSSPGGGTNKGNIA